MQLEFFYPAGPAEFLSGYVFLGKILSPMVTKIPGPRDSMEDLVSVVIPAYNMQRYVGEAIESVLCQDHKNIEIIVIDDGSGDDTPSIVETYRESTDVVRLISFPENRGLGFAVHYGFSVANGEYISFLSADDAYRGRSKIKNQISVMKKRRADWSFYTSFYYGTGNGLNLRMTPCFMPFLDDYIVKDPDILFIGLLFKNPINSSSMMITRNCLAEGGNWNKNLKYDLDGELFLRYCMNSMKVARVHGAPIFYRKHPGQLSTHRDRMRKVSGEVRLNILSQISDARLKKMVKKAGFLLFWLSHITRNTKKYPEVYKYLMDKGCMK